MSRLMGKPAKANPRAWWYVGIPGRPESAVKIRASRASLALMRGAELIALKGAKIEYGTANGITFYLSRPGELAAKALEQDRITRELAADHERHDKNHSHPEDFRYRCAFCAEIIRDRTAVLS